MISEPGADPFALCQWTAYRGRDVRPATEIVILMPSIGINQLGSFAGAPNQASTGLPGAIRGEAPLTGPRPSRGSRCDVLQVRLDLRHRPERSLEIVVDRAERRILDAAHLVAPLGVRLARLE